MLFSVHQRLSEKSNEKPFQKLKRLEQILAAGKKHSIQELANELQIDPRSVFRYLNRLTTTGIHWQTQIRTNRTKEYWISKPSHSVPSDLMESVRDLDQELSSGGIHKYHRLLKTVQEHLQGLSPAQRSSTLSHAIINKDFILDHGPFAETNGPSQTQHHVVDKILQAIHNQQRLRLVYRQSDKENATRTLLFDPHAICLRIGRLYVIGFEKDKTKKPLNLVFQRIVQFSRTHENFHRQPIHVPALYKYCFGQWIPRNKQNPIQIVLLIHDAWIQKIFEEAHFNPRAKISHTPNGIQVQLKLYQTPDLENWLLGLFPGITVLGPESLRKKLRMRLQKGLQCFYAQKPLSEAL